MSNQSFYKELRSKSDSLWQAIFSHPFVTGIGDGTLERDKYEFFLKQDYLYLIELSRLLALGSAKAPNYVDMGYFAKLLDITLNSEMELHRKTCKEFGIEPKNLEKTEPAMIMTAYTNLLVRTCYEGSFRDIVAALLPCAIGYYEIGKQLKEQGLPENRFYRDWINTYAADEYGEVCNWLRNKIDELTANSSHLDKVKLFRLYLSSARFEYLFFDMSWKKEMWGEEIPL